MIKHLGIRWYLLTAFGPGQTRPTTYQKLRLTEKAERAPEYL